MMQRPTHPQLRDDRRPKRTLREVQTPPVSTVIGVSTGLTAGVVVLCYREDGRYHRTPVVVQCSAHATMTVVRAFLASRPAGRTVVACERFTAAGTLASGAASRLLCAALQRLGDIGVEVVWHRGADTRVWATDARLYTARLMFPTASMPYARNAARHAVLSAHRDLLVTGMAEGSDGDRRQPVAH